MATNNQVNSNFYQIGVEDANGNVIAVDNLDYVQWDTTATPAGAVARQTWDDGSGMLAYTVKGGNLELRIGEDLASLCFQNTGGTIAKGKVVYLAGAQGQRPRVALADNSSDTTSSKTFGLVAESFPSGDEKFVLTQGILRNIDTNAYAPGTILWLGTNGDYTSTKPVAPAHLVFIGVVLKQNSSSGEIYVKIQNGYELDEIHDVLITTPVADNSLLQYDSTSSLWKNEAPGDVLNTLLPSQTGNANKFLQTNGTSTLWTAAATVDEAIVFAIALGG